MVFDYETLKVISLLVMGVLFTGFAITGGLDLGVGALMPFLGKTDEERRTILNSIGPTWEGNQVWLITAVAALFAAWPLMYATAFSSFYAILFLLLFSLILRPPGMDYRSKLSSKIWRSSWDFCLFLSGFLPLFLFGVAFGNLLLGTDFHYEEFLLPILNSSFFSLLNPYAFLCGMVSLSILLLQGALFIQLKTEGLLNHRSLKAIRFLGILFLICFSLALALTLFKLEGFQIEAISNLNETLSPFSKSVSKGQGFWLNNYKKYPSGYLAPLLSGIGVILALILSAQKRPGLALFFNSIALSAVIITAGFTLFPFILPSSTTPNHSLTIWDTVSSHLTLSWLFWIVVIFLPIILSYTTWVFRVMRGKVSEVSKVGEKEILKKKEVY